MFIDSAKNTLKIASRLDELTSDGTHYLLRMRRESAAFLYENRDAMPTDERYAEAAAYLKEITELEFSLEQTKNILSLYPNVKISLATSSLLSSREGLSFVAAHFFLGCDWPVYGDNIEVDDFLNILKKSANLMGFPSTTAEA